MTYKAKKTYKDVVIAESYEADRFQSLFGKIVNWLEKRSMLKGLFYIVNDAREIKILDAPSGTGRLSYELIKRGYRVVSADISLEMINKGELIYHLTNSRNFIGYVCCDLEHLPFKNNSIDVIQSLRIMGHLPPLVKQQVLREFSRVNMLGVVIMFVTTNVELRLIKWILRRILGKKNKALPWFPQTHQTILDNASDVGWVMKFNSDLFYRISESRVYVFLQLQLCNGQKHFSIDQSYNRII